MTKSKSAKKALPKISALKTKKINVFSKAFTSMLRNAAAGTLHKLVVECSTEGNLRDNNGKIRTFDSLDEANLFAGEHADKFGPGHDCIVTTTQHG